MAKGRRAGVTLPHVEIIRDIVRKEIAALFRRPLHAGRLDVLYGPLDVVRHHHAHTRGHGHRENAGHAFDLFLEVLVGILEAVEQQQHALGAAQLVLAEIPLVVRTHHFHAEPDLGIAVA